MDRSRSADVMSSLSDRSDSEQRVDLHVYVVPPELWQEHLQSAVNQIISDTVSAGFIRVLPETIICNLRTEIEAQLDSELIPKEFVFLRCVGRCFTRLRPKQERALKVKHFIPPQTYAPELFILESTPEMHVPSTGTSSLSSVNSRMTQRLAARNSWDDGERSIGSRPLPPIARNVNNTRATQTGNEGWRSIDDMWSSPTGRRRGHRDMWSSDDQSPMNPTEKATQTVGLSNGGPGTELAPLSTSPPISSRHDRGLDESEQLRLEFLLRKQKDDDMRKAEELERKRREDAEREARTRQKREDERKKQEQLAALKQAEEEQRRKKQRLEQDEWDAEQQRRLADEQRKIEEEKRRIEEEQDKIDEEKWKMEEEKRRIADEALEEQKRLEAMQREAEYQRLVDEEQRKIDEEKRKLEDEQAKIDEEKRKIEEEKRRIEAKRLEEARKLEEQRRQFEEKKKREQERLRLEAEEKKRELERRKREEEREKMEKASSLKEAEKAELLKELEEIRATRLESEQEREELMKRAKQLQIQARTNRNNNRDAWRKKYFEEKRKTAPLEEETKKLRHELEVIHKKILSQMEKIKDVGAQYTVVGRPSDQNNLRIQSVRLQQEIDTLQQRISDIQMKLTAEMKLRNQVEQELKSLKSDLTQKRTRIRALQVIDPSSHAPRSVATQRIV